MDSTPPATTMSMRSTMTCLAAVAMVISPDEHWRSIDMPATVTGKPANRERIHTGTRVGHVRALPEGGPIGEDEEDAKGRAAEASEGALSAGIVDGTELPQPPARPAKHRHLRIVELPLMMSLKTSR